jgi:2-dehydro-3-deoxygluconokinase
MGIYFLEWGANQKPSNVIYDREGSAIAVADPDQIHWREIFEHADWFHITGITPAISQNAATLSIEAVKTAKSIGLTVSCDLNYRSKLWKYGKDAPNVMRELVKYTDICIANEGDIQKSLGIGKELSVETGQIKSEKYLSMASELMNRYGNVRVVAITLRESISADHNNWSACLYDGNDFWYSTQYNIHDIVDRVGSGDSFSAGLIYGLKSYAEPQKALEFAAAASCLKHSIKGDLNRVRVEEVEAIMGGKVSGRIKR